MVSLDRILSNIWDRQDYAVRPFVMYNSFNSWGWLDQSPAEIRKELDIFSGDIRDPHGVHTAMKGCDAVLHLAALIAIPYSYHSPDTYIDTNIKGTLNIVQAARDLGVSKVVHTSTSEVYGTARFLCRSLKSTLCKANRPTPLPRSGQIGESLCLFIGLLQHL